MPQDSKARGMHLSESWRHFTLNEKAFLYSRNVWMADSMKPSYLRDGSRNGVAAYAGDADPSLRCQASAFQAVSPTLLREPGGCHLYVAWLTCGQEGLGQAWD